MKMAIKALKTQWQRSAYLLAALATAATMALSYLSGAVVYANQLSSRSIELSDGAVSGGTITSGVGSGTGVAYSFSFTTSASAQSLVVDFCSNSPIIGDTCTAPTGFNAASATASGGTLGGWTLTATTNQIKLAGATAVAAGAQTFVLNNVTNPSAAGSYYARIYTFANGTFGTYASATSPGNYVDYGGDAMSVTNAISISARVQETMLFCVSGAAPTANCGGVTTPTLTLGHGTNNILDSSAVDTANAYIQTSTNAQSGVVIRMRNSNSSGGLNSGTNVIPAVNGGAATSGTITAGTAAFGLNVAAPTGGTGTISVDTNYGPTAGQYGMDTTSTPDNVTTTYGDRLAYSTAPVNGVNDTLTFAATASNTTPAGVYTATMDLIATGTF